MKVNFEPGTLIILVYFYFVSLSIKYRSTVIESVTTARYQARHYYNSSPSWFYNYYSREEKEGSGKTPIPVS